MNKKMFPAAVAALALSFSTVAAPQAIADETSTEDQTFIHDVELEPVSSQTYWVGDLFSAISQEDPGYHNEIEKISFSQGGTPIGWLDYEFNFDEGTRLLKATDTAPKGNHILTATVTYQEEADRDPVTGDFHVTITGDDVVVSDTPELVIAEAEVQDTGITIANRTHGENPTVVTAEDKNGETVPVTFGTPSEGKEAILVNPGAAAVGPITLTIKDDELADDVTKTVPVAPAPITTTLSGNAGAVKATDAAQKSGLSVTNRVAGKATITAVDEDGQSIPVTFGTPDADGKETILVTPGTGVDGPITLTFEHPALAGKDPWTYEVAVAGHAADRDDNGVEPVVVSGTPRSVQSTDAAQDTGLRIKNETAETSLSARDEDGTTIAATVSEGKILLTPGTDVDGPITLVVSDESMSADRTFNIAVEGHEVDRDDNDTPPAESGMDEGSSLSSTEDAEETDGINWGVIGILGVLAAVIGVIAAIGGGFLPLL